MYHRLTFLLKYYLFFVAAFVVQKPLFMAYHQRQFGAGVSVGEWFAVMGHGLSMDLSMSGYICLIPFLLVAASIWLSARTTKRIINIYTCVAIAIVTLFFAIDLDLYAYWNFRLDVTPLAFLSSPKNAFASIDTALIFRQMIIMALYFFVLFFTYKKLISKSIINFPQTKWGYFAPLLVASASLFLPIRGGFSAATMNVGWVYFSDNMFLNHAAINPLWNFLDSLTRQDDAKGKYSFFPEERAEQLFRSLYERGAPPQADTVLRIKRPNIILVILEGFSANVIGALGGDSTVTPRLNQLSREGILFKHIYATSFRTDRGIASLLSGYPSQPLSSVMKHPAKSGSLPNLGTTLKESGYDLSFYYGGDENFTNMRSYLVHGGFLQIISNKDFSRKEYASSWGAADQFVFTRMLSDLNQRTGDAPFFNVLLTLSSHEPFTVPMERRFEGEDMGNKYRNAVYYTDSCIGAFVEEAKKQAWWKNTVVIFISDHSFSYPDALPIHVPERYHIPMVWIGGVIPTSMEVEKVGFQPDFINTILCQLEINDHEFRFGKNLLDPNTRGFACYTYNHGVGFVGEEGYFVLDLNTNTPILQSDKGEYGDVAKAFLHVTFDDFAIR